MIKYTYQPVDEHSSTAELLFGNHKPCNGDDSSAHVEAAATFNGSLYPHLFCQDCMDILTFAEGADANPNYSPLPEGANAIPNYTLPFGSTSAATARFINSKEDCDITTMNGSFYNTIDNEQSINVNSHANSKTVENMQTPSTNVFNSRGKKRGVPQIVEPGSQTMLGKKRSTTSEPVTNNTATSSGYKRKSRRIGRSINTDESTRYNEGVSHLYIDLGDCCWRCQYCNAAFWFGERLKGTSNNTVMYNRCCGGGQVYLRQELDPPYYVKELFKNKHFLEHICAYNQMFSMTSFGAKIHDSINDGRGPYVFKISGEIYHWIGTLCPEDNKEPKFLQLYIYDTENEVANRMNVFGGEGKSNLNPQIVQSLIQILDEHNELVQIFRTARDKCNEADVPEFKVQLYNVVLG